jgi:hypothetical protein
MLPLQALDGGLLGAAAQAAVLAGTLVLVLALVALGAFAYREIAGDGVEWPDETDDEDEAQRGDSSDEWKYY